MKIGAYFRLLGSTFFSPFYKKSEFHKSCDWKTEPLWRAFPHAILGAVTGWMALGWLFVDRERFIRFLRGEWSSPAKVYGYESNGSFMIQTLIYLLLFLWVVPSVIQIFLYRSAQNDHKVTFRESFICHSYSSTLFGFLLMPIILSLSWKDPVSWKMYLPERWEWVVYGCFFAILFYNYVVITIRSHRELGASDKKSLWHLSIPILFSMALILWEIF